MAARLAIALAALSTIACAAIGIAVVAPWSYVWSTVLLGLLPVLAAALLVVRHRYAPQFLALTAVVWAPFAPIAAFAILLVGGNEMPAWFVPVLAVGTIASIASIVALLAGMRFLGGGVRIRR